MRWSASSEQTMLFNHLKLSIINSRSFSISVMQSCLLDVFSHSVAQLKQYNLKSMFKNIS